MEYYHTIFTNINYNNSGNNTAQFPGLVIHLLLREQER